MSRRQAEIVRVDGRFAIRSLSENPILLNGALLPCGPDSVEPPLPVQDGDQILLQRSGILLTCLQPAILSQMKAVPLVLGGHP